VAVNISSTQPPLKLSLHWQSLLKKLLQLINGIADTPSCLGSLGRSDTNPLTKDKKVL
jgi:hypothetical protein